jgi:hypothetical protein
MAAAERDVEAATPTTGAAIRPERSDRQSVVAPQDSHTGQQQNHGVQAARRGEDQSAAPRERGRAISREVARYALRTYRRL